MLIKINYYKKMLEQINGLDHKPSLLLHVCCVICATTAIEQLLPYFNITLFFSNSNINDNNEYDKRFKELERYIDIINKEKNIELLIINDKYDFDNFNKKIIKLKDEKEGGLRCEVCFGLRLKRVFKYASINDFEYCTTTLTTGRYKNAQKINQIADSVSKQYDNVKYLYSDFKKGDGHNQSILLMKKYKLYHQNYCGCEYSKSV